METFETIMRGWTIEGRSVRPDHRMVGHTGFITVARKRLPLDLLGRLFDISPTPHHPVSHKLSPCVALPQGVGRDINIEVPKERRRDLIVGEGALLDQFCRELLPSHVSHESPSVRHTS